MRLFYDYRKERIYRTLVEFHAKFEEFWPLMLLVNFIVNVEQCQHGQYLTWYGLRSNGQNKPETAPLKSGVNSPKLKNVVGKHNFLKLILIWRYKIYQEPYFSSN